jgi:hypothetical protein
MSRSETTVPVGTALSINAKKDVERVAVISEGRRNEREIEREPHSLNASWALLPSRRRRAATATRPRLDIALARAKSLVDP